MSVKYIGLDVHQATTAAAVMDDRGKLVMESILETKAWTLLEFLHGLGGELHVTLEEGSWAAWLHDVFEPHVQRVIVCDPRKNALLKQGNKYDKIDARKLAKLLRAGLLSPVYHGESGLRTLRELARSYLTLTQDVTRVMNRIKAVYRGRGIPCASQKFYNIDHRDEWLKKLREPGLRRRAERLYQQLDHLQPLRQQARREMLEESRRHPANRWLREIPYVGSIRAALLIAWLQTPHRFRTRRQLWAYSGLAVEVHSSGDYHFAQGQLQRTRKANSVRGLTSPRAIIAAGFFLFAMAVKYLVAPVGQIFGIGGCEFRPLRYVGLLIFVPVCCFRNRTSPCCDREDPLRTLKSRARQYSPGFASQELSLNRRLFVRVMLAVRFAASRTGTSPGARERHTSYAVRCPNGDVMSAWAKSCGVLKLRRTSLARAA